MEQNRLQKQTQTYLDNQFLTKWQKHLNGDAVIFSTHGTKTIGYPYAKKKKKWSLSHNSPRIQNGIRGKKKTVKRNKQKN